MMDGVFMIAPGIGPPSGGADLVGNKAFNLMRLCGAGMPVPPGFVLSVDWCRRRRAGSLTEEELDAGLAAGIAELEALTGQRSEVSESRSWCRCDPGPRPRCPG